MQTEELMEECLNEGNSPIRVFKNSNYTLRTFVKEDGTVLFCAKDVATALGYQDTPKAIERHCKSGERVFHPHANGIGGTYFTYIGESDLYRLIMRSNLPKAEEFQDWVCEDVLPSIRKTGSYNTQKPKVDPFSFEDEVRAGMSWIKGLSEELRLSDVSKLGLYKQFGDPRGLPTPDYVHSKGVVFSATYLLKQKGIDIGTPTFNNLLENYGILETKTRPSSKGGEKKFRCLTEKGLEFGENQQSPKNPKETQPLYYEDKFEDLLNLIGLR